MYEYNVIILHLWWFKVKINEWIFVQIKLVYNLGSENEAGQEGFCLNPVAVSRLPDGVRSDEGRGRCMQTWVRRVVTDMNGW